jgi:hypothetical protein
MTFLPVFQEIQIDSADVLTATATTRQDAGGLLADVGLANEASRDLAMAAPARSRDTWIHLAGTPQLWRFWKGKHMGMGQNPGTPGEHQNSW